MILFADEKTPKTTDPEAPPPTEIRPEDPEVAEEAASAEAETPPATLEEPAVVADEPVAADAPAVAVDETAAATAEPAVADEPAAPVDEPVAAVDEAAADGKSAPAKRAAPRKRSPQKSPKRTAPPRASEQPPDLAQGRAVIKVIGVGGGGGNAVNRMIEAGVDGVEFIVANTDAQVLDRSLAPVRIQLGRERTGGLGCGGDPEIGRLAARDDMDELIAALTGADMVFITVGEGGGTGTGAAPVVACVAQEIEALSVAVATKPLRVEGKRRRDTGDDGIRELREYVDTLICVPNDRVVAVYGEKPIREAFCDADDVVRQAVQGISDLIQIPGEINLDFADVRMAMRGRGDAVMGIGVASGDERVIEATQAAISSPLLEDTSIRGATSIIVNVTGGASLTLNEVQRAAEVVREAVAPENGNGYGALDAEPGDNILLGTALHPALSDADDDQIQVTVVATGFPERSRVGATPQDFAAYAGRTNGRAAAPRPNGHAPDGNGVFRPERRPEPVASDPEQPAPEDESASEPLVADFPPVTDPDDAGDDRWGDLETPPFLNRREG